MPPANAHINWQQPILLFGKPGSGKSQAICHSVVKHVGKEQNIPAAAPTGYLASHFRAILPDEVTCDTAFCLPHTHQ